MDVDFKSEYLTDHLITCIGNKRSLLPFIANAIEDIRKTLAVDKISAFDGFSGSGCVSRLLKHYTSVLYINDLEAYSETGNLCYLSNASKVPPGVDDFIAYLNANKLDPTLDPGFIEKNYTPIDDDNIKMGERVFYTRQNAKIIDNARRIIGDFVEVEPIYRPYLIAPLLVKASIHNNTSGVFKGFHKKDGIGHFGGRGEAALSRIKGEITLKSPIFCQHECPIYVSRGDTNQIVNTLPELDLVYYDPPYNQHPYGSNYFMLNIINDYDAPAIQNGVAGISVEWNKSDYNKRNAAAVAMEALISNTKSKYILISYNDEGIISLPQFEKILKKYGTVELREYSYNSYRGAKNFGKTKQRNDGTIRPLNVKELLWVLKT